MRAWILAWAAPALLSPAVGVAAEKTALSPHEKQLAQSLAQSTVTLL